MRNAHLSSLSPRSPHRRRRRAHKAFIALSLSHTHTACVWRCLCVTPLCLSHSRCARVPRCRCVVHRPGPPARAVAGLAGGRRRAGRERAGGAVAGGARAVRQAARGLLSDRLTDRGVAAFLPPSRPPQPSLPIHAIVTWPRARVRARARAYEHCTTTPRSAGLAGQAPLAARGTLGRAGRQGRSAPCCPLLATMKAWRMRGLGQPLARSLHMSARQPARCTIAPCCTMLGTSWTGSCELPNSPQRAFLRPYGWLWPKVWARQLR